MKKYLGLAAFVALVGVFALIVGGQGSAGGHKHRVKADTLTGYQEATPAGVSTTATGTFAAEIDDDAQVITYTLTYVGLSTPATQAHVHFGNRYTSGGVSFFLCAGDKPACPAGTTTEAVVTGTITPANVIGPATQGIAAGEWDEIVAAMRSGMGYANVHSTQFPAGEIRGQVNDDDQRQPE
jgi:hypothetical protein